MPFVPAVTAIQGTALDADHSHPLLATDIVAVLPAAATDKEVGDTVHGQPCWEIVRGRPAIRIVADRWLALVLAAISS